MIMTTEIILAVSGIFLGAMLLGKAREMRAGKALFSIGSENSDKAVARAYGAFVGRVKAINASSGKRFAVRQVVRAERFVMAQFEKLSRRFGVIGDVVTGRDIPKNKGSVSFFLKNIENVKKGELK